MNRITTTAESETEHYLRRELLVNGCKVSVTFPKEPNEKAMSMIKNILIDSYMKKLGNT